MVFFRALVPVLRDMLSTFVFVALFWLTDNIFVATALGIALGVGQALWKLRRKFPIGPLQWLSLVLITVFGTTTIITHDPFYIMLKPSLLWLALGAVLLRRDWMAPYLPPIVSENLDDHLIVRAGQAWALLMLVLAVMNLLVAFATTNTFQFLCDLFLPDNSFFVVHAITPKFWSVYALIAPVVSQFALLAVLFIMFRKRVMGRMRARAAAQAA